LKLSENWKVNFFTIGII